MNKRIFVVGDTELGKCDNMDNFSDDAGLIEFIEELPVHNKNEEILLIFNGDALDFLKMEYKGEYPRYITEEVSLWKLERIMEAHPAVFAALKNFASHKNACVYFIIGNHDADLIWPAVQEKIHSYLGKDSKVYFPFTFAEGDLHIEHGNLIDPFFDFDVEKPIVKYKGEKILGKSVQWEQNVVVGLRCMALDLT